MTALQIYLAFSWIAGFSGILSLWAFQRFAWKENPNNSIHFDYRNFTKSDYFTFTLSLILSPVILPMLVGMLITVTLFYLDRAFDHIDRYGGIIYKPIIGQQLNKEKDNGKKEDPHESDSQADS